MRPKKSIFIILSIILLSGNLFAQSSQLEITKISQLDTGNFATYIYVDKTIAAVSDTTSRSITLINITDPHTLTILSKIIEANPHELKILNDILYFTGYDFAELVMVNITNPNIPETLGKYRNYDKTTGLDVDFNYAYLASQEDGILILNVTDPTNPNKLGELDLDRRTTSVVVENNFAYVADKGLSIVDISNRSNPVLVGDYYDNGALYQLVLKDGYIFGADYDNGLIIIDVNDPSNPILISQTTYGEYTSSIFIENDLVYLTMGNFADAGYQGGISVIDVTNKGNPVEVASWDDGSPFIDIFKSRDTIYTAGKDKGMELFQLRNVESNTNTSDSGLSAYIPFFAFLTIALCYKRKRYCS